MGRAAPAAHCRLTTEQNGRGRVQPLPITRSLRVMRPYTLLLVFLLAGCQTSRIYEVPDVPPDATTLILTNSEMPRTLYASAWGAFAEYDWTIVDRDSDAMRLVAQPPDLNGTVEVSVESNSPRAIAREGRIVASVDPADPDAQAVFGAAVEALASVPGQMRFR